MVSGMSAYTTASTTAGSTVTGSGRPASTVGGRKPHKQKNRQKVRSRCAWKRRKTSSPVRFSRS